MGLNISFFKTPKHRVFNYRPIFYDERKERIQNAIENAKQEKAEREGEDWKNERYIPGRNIRGSFQAASKSSKRHAMNPSVNRIITLVSLAILFVLVYYVAQYFGWFVSLLK